MIGSRERAAILAAGLSADQAIRGRACAIVLSQQGPELEEARRLLAESYLRPTVPSFHLIPRGDAMLPLARFQAGYQTLEKHTKRFADVTAESIHAALQEDGAALAPLRMIAGVTYNELAVAIELATGKRVTGSRLRKLERESSARAPESKSTTQRSATFRVVADTVIAVVARTILEVPPAVQASFHSKLEKRDTEQGWSSVSRDAVAGVPYSALLYQRYVGGLWRQVEDAYSEVKGDAILEQPLETLLQDNRISYWRTPPGVSGAMQTARRFGIEPGPDFLIPDENPQVIIESKVAEDGGTARDKAARIQRLADVGSARGLVVCAVVDGKGWRERPGALANVVIATNGRTFSLATLPAVLEVPEVRAWRGTAPMP